MPPKRPDLNSETVTMLRQVTGRYASKFTRADVRKGNADGSVFAKAEVP
jgi:hypothetical protein